MTVIERFNARMLKNVKILVAILLILILVEWLALKLKLNIMYIIEFEKGVYSTKGAGDPARTLKVENAKRFIYKVTAKSILKKILKEIEKYRKFPNARVVWVDEFTGVLAKRSKFK